MEKKIKVMLADNSESFGVPCSSVMHMYGIETQTVSYTHLDVYKRQVSDRVIFMDGGVIVEEGDPNQVIDHPENERTKAFLARFNQEN